MLFILFSVYRLDLQAVVTALAAFGPVVSIELVVAEVSCSLEGPDVTETVDGTDVTVHVRPLLGSTPQGGAAAAGLNFEAFAVYRTAAAALQAVASFTGRQLTFTIPERGPFYVRVVLLETDPNPDLSFYSSL